MKKEIPKNGLHTEYHKNGQKDAENNYKDGNLVSSRYYHYYENGQIWWEKNIKFSKEYGEFGKEDGKQTDWHENGQIKSETNYKDGKRDGKFTSWLNNGQKDREKYYKDNIPEGDWTSWFENGLQSGEGSFKDGTGTFLELHENKKKSYEVIYKDGLGKETWWYENGKKKKVENFKDGKRNGKAFEYHENGSMKEVGIYKDGKPDAYWQWWDENGNKGSWNYDDDKDYNLQMVVPHIVIIFIVILIVGFGNLTDNGQIKTLVEISKKLFSATPWTIFLAGFFAGFFERKYKKMLKLSVITSIIAFAVIQFLPTSTMSTMRELMMFTMSEAIYVNIIRFIEILLIAHIVNIFVLMSWVSKTKERKIQERKAEEKWTLRQEEKRNLK